MFKGLLRKGDLLLAAVFLLAAVVVAMLLHPTETFYAWTRDFEVYQLDDLMLVLSGAIIVLLAALVLRGRRLLRQEIEVRTELERQLRERARLLDGFIEHSPTLLSVKDDKGRFLLVSRGFERLAGVPREQILGRRLSELFPGELSAIADDEDRIVLGQGSVLTTEGPMAIAPQRQSLTTRFPLLGEDGEPCASAAIALDITERLAAEEALRRRDAVFMALSLAAEELLQESDWRRVAPALLRELGQALQVSRVYVFENHVFNGDLCCSQRFEWVAPGVTAQIGNPATQSSSYRETGFGDWVPKLESGQAVHGLTRAMAPEARRVLENQGIQSIAVMPVLVDGWWWGFLGFDHCEEAREWDLQELEVLQIAASILGVAISRHRSLEQHEAARQALAEQEALYRAVFEGNTAVKLLVDPVQARVVDANPAAAEFYGYAVKELRDMPLSRFVLADAKELRANLDRASRLPCQLRVRHLRADGQARHVDILTGPVETATGTLLFCIVQDVTEEVVAAEELRRAKERFETLVQASTTGLVVVQDGVVVFANPEVSRMTGVSVAELQGRSVLDSIHEDDVPKAEEILRRVILEQQVAPLELRILNAQGAPLWVSAGSVAFQWDGRPASLHYVVDISELKASEERYALATRAAKVGVWDWDIVHDIFYADPRFLADLGHEPAEALKLSATIVSHIHPEDLPQVREALGAHLDGETPEYTARHRVVSAGGEEHWLLVHGQASRDAEGKPVRMTGTMLDVTEAMAVEQELERQRLQYETIINTSSDLMLLKDTEGRILLTNTAYATLYRTTPRELQGRSDMEVMGSEIGRFSRDADNTALRFGSTSCEYQFMGKTLHLVKQLVSDPQGKPAGFVSVIRDVTEYSRLDRELSDERRMLRSIIDAIPDLIFFKDAAGVYRRTNRAFQDSLGLGEDEIVGKSDTDLFDPGWAAFYREKDLAVIRAGRTLRNEEIVMHPSSRPGDMEMLKTPVYDPDGGLSGVIGVGREITVRKSMERELRRAKQAADRANRSKSEFLAVMSHEIRTPMNGILGMAEIALLSDPGPKQRHYLDNITASGLRLLRIVNDILDFTRVEAGELELVRADFSLGRLVHEVAAGLAPLARRKGLTLSHVVLGDVPDGLHGDAGRIEQVLYNLLGNAIKFTERGSCGLKVCLAEPGELPGFGADSQVAIAFIIVDTGAGISEEQLPRLFDAFTQMDSSYSRRQGGSGLGLSITRRLVELMGGTITVQSTRGRGSVFRVVLPLEPARASQEASQETHFAGQDATKHRPRRMRVLVVDDDPINREVAESLLRLGGHRVMTAPGAEAGIELLARQPFDLVLLDVQMPEVDGLEAIRRIRRDTSGLFAPDIPVLGLTAHAQQDRFVRFVEAGMDGVLSKPLRREALDEALRELARSRGLILATQAPLEQPALESTPEAVAEPTPIPEWASAPPPPTQPAAPATAVLDTAEALERLEGNQALYARLLERFLHNGPDSLAELARLEATTGRESPESPGSAAAARGQVHLLKGRAAAVGAERLAKICEELEDRLSEPSSAGLPSLAPASTALEQALATVSAYLQERAESVGPAQ